MLLVETFIANSEGKGIGLFALTLITEGTIVWIRDLNFDLIFEKEEIEKFPLIAQKFLYKHSDQEVDGNRIVCGDNARFMNHSESPNLAPSKDSNGIVSKLIAIREIKTGEEIFCDYKATCASCVDGLDFQPK